MGGLRRSGGRARGRPHPAQLRTRTFRTLVYATACARESWRNLRLVKAGLLSEAAVAGHRSVRGKALRPRVAPGRCFFAHGSRGNFQCLRIAVSHCELVRNLPPARPHLRSTAGRHQAVARTPRRRKSSTCASKCIASKCSRAAGLACMYAECAACMKILRSKPRRTARSAARCIALSASATVASRALSDKSRVASAFDTCLLGFMTTVLTNMR